jgi:hypothetical protein
MCNELALNVQPLSEECKEPSAKIVVPRPNCFNLSALICGKKTVISPELVTRIPPSPALLRRERVTMALPPETILGSSSRMPSTAVILFS